MKRVLESFDCLNCGTHVEPIRSGTRNHCNHCLCSAHVDREPGSRSCECKGLMEPIAIETRSGLMYIIHECSNCGFKRSNRTATDDNQDAIIHAMQVGNISAQAASV